MHKISTGEINVKSIKHLENSRLRDLDDVSDLMTDIEKRGLLENVAIRRKDNALIFGNRRVKAFEKLGYTSIPCDFYEDISDEELLLANLAENMKRKDIGSIEIGRICSLLIDKGMNKEEVAVKLGVTKQRVDRVISAYKVTLNTPFEKLVRFGERGVGAKGISESFIWKVQNTITRGLSRPLNKEDWALILKAAENGTLTMDNISELRKILLSNSKIGLDKAISLLNNNCIAQRIYLAFDLKKLNEALSKEKCETPKELVRAILRKYDKDLLF